MIQLNGSMVALVTPMSGGQLDEARLRELVDWQIANGTRGLIPCGTTGESATLSHSEHRRVVELVIEQAAGRVPVIAGTGSNSTSEAIALTQHARESGADAALVITPYYNKPTQEGLFQHYTAIANAVEIPIVLYNVPSRTGVNIEPETVARLAHHPNIIAIKEASGSLDYVSSLRLLSDIAIVSGNDNLNLPLLSIGAVGFISVLANVTPRLCADQMEAITRGDWATARNIHEQTFRLVEALFCETNPIPVKAALAMMGRIEPEIRLPLTPLHEKHIARVRAELEALQLVPKSAEVR